jgi:uncharacterized repeat protein (TIGR02543 family)
VKIKIGASKRAIYLSIVMALISSLLSISSSPANASPPTCYVVVEDILTDGSACSGNVVIAEGVTKIGARDGYGAFYRSGITSVAIPASVTEIGWEAFAYASNLTSVTIADSSLLVKIDHHAFAGTRSLKSLTLPSSLNLIGSMAFNGSGIRYLTFKGSLPVVMGWAGRDDLQGTSANAIAWVTANNFTSFDSRIPKILPNIGSLAVGANSPPPTISSPTNGETLTATVGVNYNGSVNFFGLQNPILEVSSGSLPPGISLNTTTGALSGTPTTTAPLVTRTYPVSFRVTDGAGSATVTVSFEILPPSPPEIYPETFTANVGVPINKGVNFYAIGLGTVTLVDGSSLPPGVSISGSNRLIGTPTLAGTYTAELRVTDSYSQSMSSDEFTFEIGSPVTVNISASRQSMNLTTAPVDPVYSVISSSAPDDFIICGFYKDADNSGAVHQIDNCTQKQASNYISDGISSDDGQEYNEFENSTWVFRVFGPDSTDEEDPDINTPYLATVTVNVRRAVATPAITIGTTSFAPRVATNVGVTLTGFNESLSYQATVKFVNATTNVDVSNGTLAATSGSTTLISGYTSYSSSKLGFKGTYAQIAAALASMTWNPATAAANISMRIGISTVPGANEFYDANSGRYYRFVAAGTTWTQARTNSEATTLFGLRGYLAEITSAAENSFIANETSAFNIWIGATEDALTASGDGQNNKGWTGTSYNGSAGQRWIWNGAVETPLPVGTGAIAQGPSAAYSAWRSVGTIEPNNDSKPGADCALTNWGAKGVWNDRPCNVSYSYLIEFGGRPGETSTAAGATLTTTVSAGTPVQYTITYNPNSGTTTPTQASRTTGQTFILANEITRNASGDTSYQFAGWRSGSIIYKAGETITVGTANLTFTAVWVQLYEVTYAVNGGTFSGSETVNDAECLAGGNRCTINQSITLNAAPTRAGYTFAGWTNPSGAAVADTDNAVTGVQTAVTTTNYIFTASWTAITYAITYVSSGSTAPTQSALQEGQSFTVAAAATRTGFEFNGWSDGDFIFLPDSDFTVGTSAVTLTAQWTALYTVTYSQGLGSGTPTRGSESLAASSELAIADDAGISRSGFTFAGWNDGTTTYQPGASYTLGTSNVTFTAQWTEIPVAPTPVPVVVPIPVVPVGPPPSVLKTITNPKISRDDKGYYCQVGKYVFLREGRTEETPKLTTQVYSLLSNGKVIDSIKGALDKVLFAKSDDYLDSTLTCQVDVGQENLVTTSYSLNSADISTFASARKSAIEAADVKYYKDREDAYAKKDKEFVRLAAVRSAAVIASESAREVSVASLNYQKAYKAASELWKKELADASTNRVIARELAQKNYLASLETAGISIYPTAVKAVVTPTPTPTPTPKATPTPNPTPSPSPTATNVQPTREMKKVGTVYMASGSYFLNDATKVALQAIAIQIRNSDKNLILVYGHTDNRGGVNNTLLSQNRAKAVANYLRPLLQGKKITIGWFASKKPVASGNSAADLAKNRRVEIYAK